MGGKIKRKGGEPDTVLGRDCYFECLWIFSQSLNMHRQWLNYPYLLTGMGGRLQMTGLSAWERSLYLEMHHFILQQTKQHAIRDTFVTRFLLRSTVKKCYALAVTDAQAWKHFPTSRFLRCVLLGNGETNTEIRREFALLLCSCRGKQRGTAQTSTGTSSPTSLSNSFSQSQPFLSLVELPRGGLRARLAVK